MKILIIAQYYNPDITAAASRISDSADLLSKLGHKVTVVTATPHKSHISNYDEYDKSVSSRILRVKISSVAQHGVWGMIKQYLGFSISALLKVLLNYKSISPDVIWISSPPLPVTLVSLVLKLIFRIPIVLDVRDIWPESAVNIGKIKRDSLFEKLGKKLEKLSYYHANEITCVSMNMKEYLDKLTHNKVTVIYNSISRVQMKKIYNGSPNPNIFCYAGNIGHAQNIELLIHSFELARKDKDMKKLILYIVGDGALLNDIKLLAADLNLIDSVKFFGAITKDEALEKMSEAGCLLLPLKDAPAFRITVPSKVFDYMSLSRPIITNINGEGAEIIKKCKANKIVPSENIIKFSEAMINIRKNFNNKLNIAKLNRDIVIENFTREKQVAELEKVLIRSVDISNKYHNKRN